MAKKKEVVEVAQPKEGNFDLENFMASVAGQQEDPKSKAYVELVKILYDDKKLLMISRLSKNQQTAILKNFIISDFFVEYYNNCGVKIKLLPTDEPPFYKRELTYNYPDIEEVIKTRYKGFMDKVMSITISEDGKGRDEAIQILRNEPVQPIGMVDKFKNWVGR